MAVLRNTLPKALLFYEENYDGYELTQCGVSIFRFVLEEPDSVRFHHGIIFCLESDSIVVSFLSGTGFLRVDVLQFDSNLRFPFIVCIWCIVVLIDNLRTRNDEYAN